MKWEGPAGGAEKEKTVLISLEAGVGWGGGEGMLGNRVLQVGADKRLG